MLEIDRLCKRNKPLEEFCKDRIRRLGHENGFQCRQCPHVYSEKANARRMVHRAVGRGEMVPARECDCLRCGGEARLYHHPDYSQPLNVRALCWSCHMAVHSEQHTP